MRTLDRTVESAWYVAWGLALGGFLLAYLRDDSPPASLVLCVGALLMLRGVLMMANYRGVLSRMAARDDVRWETRVGRRLGVTMASTRPIAVLEFFIGCGWIVIGVVLLPD